MNKVSIRVVKDNIMSHNTTVYRMALFGSTQANYISSHMLYPRWSSLAVEIALYCPIIASH